MRPDQLSVFALLFTPLVSLTALLFYYDVVDTLYDLILECSVYFNRLGYLLWVAIFLLAVIGYYLGMRR